jgi:peptide/nickel transport system ATP-binding protein
MSETQAVTLEAINVIKYFGGRGKARPSVSDISLTINTADAVGIVGESGSGKSTLARMLVGLERPTGGRVSLNGAEISELSSTLRGARDLRRMVQFVAQDTTSSFDPRRTLRVSARRPAQILRGLSQSEANDELDALIDAVGLNPALADRHPEQASGGQRQRFALVRALIVQPRILVCDEVVSALDISVQGSILNLIKRYCRDNGAGLVFISHGLPATAFISRHLAVMRGGELLEMGDTEQVVRRPKHSYTAELVAANDALSGQGSAGHPSSVRQHR